MSGGEQTMTPTATSPAVMPIAAAFGEVAEELARTASAEEAAQADVEKSAEAPSLVEGPAANAGASGGGAGEPPRGEEFDADAVVQRFNREWALCLIGKAAIVLREQTSGPIEDRVRIVGLEAFKAYHSNRYTLVESDDGKLTRKLWAPYWLRHRKRRTFDGIEFYPDPKDAPGTPNYFNLWRGFAIKPDHETPKAERPKKYAVFRDHLLTNICESDPKLFAWFFGWIAHIFQKPRERIGTAIVLRGGEGWGKSKVGEVIGSLAPSHYFPVDDPRYLTGQFNAHMASCLLLQIDEGFWAGDKAAEGRLKGLITAPKQMIEAKGVDPIRLDNYVRLLFSSNEDWVVPVGLDGRRFCVLDVSDRVARNATYFGEMEAQLANGGREALLADLLEFDLASVNLRDVPKTGALLEQKLRSMDPQTSWWFERLSDGSATRRAAQWNRHVPVDTLFRDYIHTSEQIGVKRKAEKTAFGMKMHKLVPGLQVTKRTMTIDEWDDARRQTTEVQKRVACYALPSLPECREHFETLTQQTIKWLVDDPGSQPDQPPDRSEDDDVEF